MAFSFDDFVKYEKDAEIGVTVAVTYKDHSGRFLTKLGQRLNEALQEMADDGRDLAIEHAPAGTKVDHRGNRQPLKASMYSRVRGKTALWGSHSKHALPVEFGGRPHEITADVRFFWEKEGRMWHKRAPGSTQMIQHPGNRSQPYLRPSFEAIWAKRNEYFRENLRDL